MRKHVKRLILSVLLGTMLLAGAGCASDGRNPAAADSQAPELQSQPPSLAGSGAGETTQPKIEWISLGGREYSVDTDSLTIRDPDFEELYGQLAGFSNLKTVTLEGELPETSQLLTLKQAYPDITFLWDFDFCGVAVNTMTEAIDLSGMPLEDTGTLEALLPCFYRLETVDMCGCGISNEEMDALNRRWPDTRFVWEVTIGSSKLRTDATFFMPFQHGLPKQSYTDFSNLRYCTEMIVLDFGHYYISDLSFLEYMPHLEYLLLGDTNIEDLTIIGSCIQLRYLELFYNPIGDFWPLTNLTNLEDLNLGHTPCYCHMSVAESWSFQPLLQMTWLDRLWMPGSRLSAEEQLLLEQTLSDTVMTFQSPGSTEQGWRYSPNNYIQRDLMGMYYLHN